MATSYGQGSRDESVAGPGESRHPPARPSTRRAASFGRRWARAASTIAVALGRLAVIALRFVLLLARSVLVLGLEPARRVLAADWAMIGRCMWRGAARAARGLRRAIWMVPRIARGTARCVLVIARGAATVTATICLSILFAGAVLLGTSHLHSDHGDDQALQRLRHLPREASPVKSGRTRSEDYQEAGSRTNREPRAGLVDERGAPASTKEARAGSSGARPTSLTREKAPPEEIHEPSKSTSSRGEQNLASHGRVAAGPSPDPSRPRAQEAAHGSATIDAAGAAGGVQPKPPSCSADARTRGPLLNPARLPDEGPGFRRVFPHRDLSWGTDELVGSIERAAASLHDPDLPPLVVGNLSGPRGDQAGADPFHPARYARGQGAGRAGDLLFFVSDALGRPVPAADTAIAFDEHGRSVAGVRRLYLDEGDPIPGGCHLSRRRAGMTEAACPMPPGAWAIDFDRTWLLVRAILTDPVIGPVDPDTGKVRPDGRGVRFIFIAESLKRRLVAAGRRAGEPKELLRIAEILLHPPSNAPPFDRFMRLDLWCTEDDRLRCGCDDGSRQWNRWPSGGRVDLRRGDDGRLVALSEGDGSGTEENGAD